MLPAVLQTLAILLAALTPLQVNDRPGAIASFIAGHPVVVRCDADTNRPAQLRVPSGVALDGWSWIPSGEVHLDPMLCADLAWTPEGTIPDGLGFTTAVATLIHEAAHAGGVETEACANRRASRAMPFVLRRWYGIPVRSRLQVAIARQHRLLMEGVPVWDRPAAC